jgi:3-oxoacyl-[acyl-carrier-protein] synthase III
MEQLEPGQVDLVFPPQISSQFISHLRGALHLPKAKFVDVAGEGPNLFSSSLPYGLAYAHEQGLVKTGDTGVMIAVGSGLQVGCAIYQF